MTQTLYEILGVDAKADGDEIKKAYKKLAMKYHPDKNRDDVDKQEKENKFKAISHAYTILSNEEKRKHYDLFGSVDEATPTDYANSMHSVFAEVFGGGGVPFNIFQGFNGHGQAFSHRAKEDDRIDISVTLSEIYHGVSKKVEYDIQEKCIKCMGSGAKEPTDVVKCISCDGKGMMSQQMGFVMLQHTCPSCGGKGQMIPQHKLCGQCNGKKIMFIHRSFDIKLPQGLPNKHVHVLTGKGSYDPESGTYNDIALCFNHQIDPQYEIDYKTKNVITSITLTPDELFCGFVKSISPYGEDIYLHSRSFVNPSKEIVVKNMGLPIFKRTEKGDLVVNINVQYLEKMDATFKKYHQVFLKMFKKPEIQDVPENAITVD